MYEKMLNILINALKILYVVFSLTTIIIVSSLIEIVFENSFDKEIGIVLGVVGGVWTLFKLKEFKVYIFNKIESFLEVEK